MRFDIALSFNSILDVLRTLVVLLVIALWAKFRQYCICVLETQEHVSSTSLSKSFFPGPRCLATFLVLLEFGSRHESFDLVHCYHAAGFPVLVPHMSASVFSKSKKKAALDCLCV